MVPLHLAGMGVRARMPCLTGVWPLPLPLTRLPCWLGAIFDPSKQVTEPFKRSTFNNWGSGMTVSLGPPLYY